MPPRAVKKAAGPGAKRGGRGRGKAAAVVAQPQPEVVDEPVKDEEVVEEVKIETVPVEVKEVDERKNLVDDDDEDDDKVEEKQVNQAKKEEDNIKESVEEYERGERLDLEDNDPEEFEPEEYGAVDYDEKEMEEHEDVQEEVDDLEEEAEDGNAGEHEEEEEEEEEGGDMVVEEEMEEAPEELEGEEDEEHAEEHADIVDTQEREEHRDVFKERRKRKEFEIFVGGLDKDATEDDLRKVFSEVGEVTEVRLMMNAQTKKNKGFAFLRFATVEQAKRACAELKNPVVNGKQCGVTPSQDSDTLFLGNISKSWTKEVLKEKLKHYGVDTLEDLTLVEDSNNEGMNRGFAFLEFSSRSDAMDAFKRLQKRDVTFGVDRPAKVSFAAQIDPDDEEMAQVTTIFVDGLPSSWDEDRVRQLLKKYGEVVKIELARNMPSAKRKDFGFVTFGTHNEAVSCANSINNETLGEGDSTAKVRARLSRPLQRGRGKLAPRGDFRSGRPVPGPFRNPWSRPAPPRTLPVHSVRRVGGRLPPIIDRGLKRPVAFRDRRPVPAMPPRGRPMAPLPRSYDRRPPVPAYLKSSMKREYGRREELPPRSRAPAEYAPPRVVSSERRSSYADEYPSRGSAYTDLPRGSSRSSTRRAYPDDNYGQRFERPPPSYREGRPREYESMSSGSKRPYSALDDVPPRYAETGVRQSRARLDYDLGSGTSQYGETYNDRIGRPNVRYSSSSGRSTISSQESHGLYSSRQGMTYNGGGSYSGSDVGGMYSSFGDDYTSRGGDVGGSSYSSLYSGRSMGGGGSYMGSGSSGSYY